MRSASPAAAIDMPTTIDPAVGSATISTSGAHTHPRATRNRASSCVGTAGSPTARGAARRACRIETTPDGRDDFVDLDVFEAHALANAAAQMMALTHRVARDGDVVDRQRTVPRRPRGSEDADDGDAERGGDVHRPGVTRHH